MVLRNEAEAIIQADKDISREEAGEFLVILDDLPQVDSENVEALKNVQSEFVVPKLQALQRRHRGKVTFQVI